MKRLLAITVAIVTLLAPLTAAFSLTADYMDRDASGNAAYEAMVVHPEAVYDATADKTYIAYQGMGLDPYVAAYDHQLDEWIGPFRAGDNPLVQDYHGGPAIAVDEDGYVHVIYGNHGSRFKHAVSSQPRTISASWEDRGDIRGSVTPNGTYAQPMWADGELRLFYRASDMSWRMVSSATGAAGSWEDPEVVIDVRTGLDAWYANFSVGPNGKTIHCAFHWRDITSTDMFTRYDLYYMKRNPDSEKWVNTASVEATMGDEYDDPYASSRVWDSDGLGVNQMVVRGADDGSADILFLTGEATSDSFDWKYLDGTAVEGSDETTFAAEAEQIEVTDSFFDAGDLDLSDPENPVAYLTTAGKPDPQEVPDSRHAARGGDITQWKRVVGSPTPWQQTKVVLAAPPGDLGTRYNDPQIVRSATGADPHDEARVMFSEWDNDGANFIHKVYLWGEVGGTGAFLGREFTPESERLAGLNRVGTAIKISRTGFPNGTQYLDDYGDKLDVESAAVFLAGKDNFPDVLCGAPLAHAYKAPLLLVSKDRLDAEVAKEIERLFYRPAVEGGIRKRIFILGGEPSVSAAVASQLKAKFGVTITRIAGSDRYETAEKVAAALQSRRRGEVPSRVVIASGEKFPDALSVSPLAARKAWPILLSRKANLPSYTRDAIVSLGAKDSLIVGSDASVSTTAAVAVQQLTGSTPVRLGGADRYATALEIARYATGTSPKPGSEKVLSAERLVLASGENFPDGLAGGVLAARFRAPMLVTTRDLVQGTVMPAPTERFVKDNASKILDVYVLGGETAVSAGVYNRLISLLPAPAAE